MDAAHQPARDPRKLRASNIRTAWVLATIALTFFCGVIVTRLAGGNAAGMGVVGFAVFVFLAFGIGRHLTGRR